MSVMRVNKNRNYTVMSNYHLQDRNLSLKAKGLLSIMLSLPEDWDYSVNGLVAICKEGETAVVSALDELKKNNYVVVTKIFPNKENGGKYEYIYDIYEEPYTPQHIETQSVENQDVENQGVGFLGLENMGLYKDIDNNNNIDYYITKKENTKEKKDKPQKDINSMIEEKNFSPEVTSELKEWVQYKKEKKQGYKPIGFSKLLTQIQSKINEYGDTAVIDCINLSMANNWQGITWDRISQFKTKFEVKKHTVDEPLDENDDEEWSDERWEEEFRKRGI